MAERSHSISKLKRKKLSVDEPRTDIHSKNAPQKNNSPLCFDGTTELDKSTTGPVRWWNRNDLCALENLWALTLKSALSSLDTRDESGSVVPDLPMASSAVTPTAADQLGKWRWPGLGEEVPPFPELSNAIPGPSPPPDSRCVNDATPEEVHLPTNEGQSPHSPGSPPSSSPGEVDPQQRTAGTSHGVPCPKRLGTPDDRGHATSSKASQQRKSSERAPCRVLAKSRAASTKEGQTSMQSWMKVPPPPQQPGITGTGGGDGESLMRVTKRPAPACQRENTDSCPPLRQGQGVDERSVEGKVVPRPSGSSGEGSGGERLQSKAVPSGSSGEGRGGERLQSKVVAGPSGSSGEGRGGERLQSKAVAGPSGSSGEGRGGERLQSKAVAGPSGSSGEGRGGERLQGKVVAGPSGSSREGRGGERLQSKVVAGPSGSSGEGSGGERLQGKVVAGPSGSSGEGRGGERLQSCPMCLVAFPAGSVQMDMDSHLAQCLSEMTMDMTW